MRAILPVVRCTVMVAAISLLFGGCTWLRSSHAIEREQLTVALGRDPVEVLRAITANQGAYDVLKELGVEEDRAHALRLVRFGLLLDDEIAVCGAVLLMGDQLPLPELRHAASVVIPRLGEPDFPLLPDDARPLIGSADFEALVPVIPRLPEEQAVGFLGQLHRMVRPDAIPALCELALATSGEVRRAAFGNACLTAGYSQQGMPQLLATYLEMAVRSPSPEPHGEGLPGVLSASLQADLDRPDVGLPAMSCARWLLDCQPTPADVPLLRGLLASWSGDLRNAAVWAIGSMTDEQSGRLLAGERPDKVVSACWLAARARRGEPELLDQLLAGEIAERIYGLAAASPERRRAFFAKLLAMPAEQSLPIVRELGQWPRGEVFESIADPPYDDQLLSDLEPLAAADKDLDVQVLRSLVATFPCCETERLADALLAYPADELFADEQGAPQRQCAIAAPYLGHGGVWAFLEVTRPEQFRRRLDEGFDSKVPAVRNLCAELLVRLCVTDRLDELAVWIDSKRHDYSFYGWLFLARDGSREVRELLYRRVAASGEDGPTDELVALAVALGMPFDFARGWEVRNHLSAIREALLAGDAGKAFLVSADGFDGWNWPTLLDWQQPEVTAFVLEQRRSGKASMPALFHFDQAQALVANDREQLERMLQPVRDGRYATHGSFSIRLAARTHGLAMLPFWIEQLGSNCCKCVLVEEVLDELFGHDSSAFERCARREPASVYLRRTLLPVADRLRWSRIATGYVVAGR